MCQMSSKDSKCYKNPEERTVKAGKKSSQRRWELRLVLQDVGCYSSTRCKAHKITKRG